MDDWVTIALALGLTLRITRLITLDTITEPIRARLSGWVLTLATCAWCASMWISVAVAVSWWAWSHTTIWQVAAVAASASWVAGATSHAGLPSRHEVEVTPVGALPVISLPPAPPGGEQP